MISLRRHFGNSAEVLHTKLGNRSEGLGKKLDLLGSSGPPLEKTLRQVKKIRRLVMTSDYSQQLNEWIKAKDMKKHDANVAEFLAVRALVKERIGNGYAATVIFAFCARGRKWIFATTLF